MNLLKEIQKAIKLLQANGYIIKKHIYTRSSMAKVCERDRDKYGIEADQNMKYIPYKDNLEAEYFANLRFQSKKRKAKKLKSRDKWNPSSKKK